MCELIDAGKSELACVFAMGEISDNVENIPFCFLAGNNYMTSYR